MNRATLAHLSAAHPPPADNSAAMTPPALLTLLVVVFLLGRAWGGRRYRKLIRRHTESLLTSLNRAGVPDPEAHLR
jgi:hypothetical protein